MCTVPYPKALLKNSVNNKHGLYVNTEAEVQSFLVFMVGGLVLSLVLSFGASFED